LTNVLICDTILAQNMRCQSCGNRMEEKEEKWVCPKCGWVRPFHFYPYPKDYKDGADTGNSDFDYDGHPR